MTSTEEHTAPAVAGTTSPGSPLPRGAVDMSAQPRVRRNDHAVLSPPPLGGWEPSLSVSVVVPAHGGSEKLALVLASLAAQSYPAHLMEVVVVDDGSPEPLVLPRVRPENTRLVVSAEGGWGSAHAVNTGVGVSSGQVVLRLDADMLVYREHVESQMRWHHLIDYGVALGHKLFVDFDPAAMTPEYVRDEVAAGRADRLFDRDSADPHWVERLIGQHDRLRTAGRLSYKVFIGATGSLHRSLFDAAGGMAPELVLGGDTEFAYRVAQQGAVFVPDLDTSSWHLGRSQMQTRRDAGTRYRSPYVSNRVPDFHLRRKRPDRQWEVPLVDVVVDTAERTLEEVDTTVSALLDGSTPDLRLWLLGPWSRLNDERRRPLDDELLDPRLIHETFRGDPRVRFVEEPPETDPRVPFRLFLGGGPALGPTAVADLVKEIDKEGAGLLCAPLPGATRAGDGLLRLERGSAYARARHLEPEAEGADLDRVVEETHGTHWIPGERFLAVDEGEEPPTARPEVLQQRLDKALVEADRMRARAQRAERKLRWFTPGLGRRVLRRIAR
ncbi:glycosyltransferase [Nocardiopsis sp. LDBS1602]|uniref:glycosyltransferase n=1 Tax=Nocardiopsis sp. LDBS1602 TaxID=3109597 RepID=UPI002DB57EBC|nr:glycosyltransferase family 2 protein [Nocardiopsis sp. LDBS1602]MEC3892442.1 glycosyltransferase family 2 protein [Nocardiopsis sp. LDBS1602]